MKITSFISIMSFLAIALITVSCSNDKSDATPRGDSTSEELSALFDNFDVLQLDTDDVIAHNGMTLTEVHDYLVEKYGASRSDANFISEREANDQLLTLTTQLVASQLTYTKRQNYQTATQPNGLAYAWNHKNPQLDLPDSDAKCQEELAGLDCSGLLHLGAVGAGLTKIPVGNAKIQMDPKVWNKALKDAGYTYLEAKFEEISSWNENDWQNGDIIVFDNGGHIGTIITRQGLPIAIVHAQGNKTDPCDVVKGPKKGPKVMGPDNDLGNWNYFVPNHIHGRLRIQLKNSYYLKMRCQGNSEWLYTFNLSIDTKSPEIKENEIPFIDYDGSHSRQKITYSFEKATSTFRFHSEITDNLTPGKRIDEFSISLAQLDQPHSAVYQFVGDFTGCPAEFLLNKGFEFQAHSRKTIRKPQASINMNHILE